MTADLMPKGEAGIRYDANANLIVGQNPRITMHADRVQEMPDGGEMPIGPMRPILDMQPTVIAFADLLSVLIEQNDLGRGTAFLGHVRVLPTSPDRKVEITDEGQVIVRRAEEGC